MNTDTSHQQKKQKRFDVDVVVATISLALLAFCLQQGLLL